MQVPVHSTRVLLTGATGVLGLQVSQKLLADGYQLRALVRNLDKAKALLPASIELVEGDISDITALSEALHGCQACVHMAGLVQFSDKHQRALLNTNHGGTANVVNACQATEGFAHLIHFGSVAGIPLRAGDEQTIPRPHHFSSFYGYSKRLSELEVHRGAAEGLGFTILQPSIVLARHPTGRSSSSVLGLALRNNTVAPPGQMHWVAGADVAQAVSSALRLGPHGKTYTLDANPVGWFAFMTDYRRQRGIVSGSVFRIPAFVLHFSALLAPLASSLFGTPIPSRRQLLNMIRPHIYPGRAEAEALLGRPFLTLDEALTLLGTSSV